VGARADWGTVTRGGTVKFVLDTNVVSALRHPTRHPGVSLWAGTTAGESSFITAFTVFEIGRGVAAMERRDPGQGARLRKWFTRDVLGHYQDRILAFDDSAALLMAEYRVPELAPVDDAYIAAIAQSRNMIVATRNVKHFEPLGVKVFNPFEFEI